MNALASTSTSARVSPRVLRTVRARAAVKVCAVSVGEKAPKFSLPDQARPAAAATAAVNA